MRTADGGAWPAGATRGAGRDAAGVAAAIELDTPVSEWHPLLIGVASVVTAVVASMIFKRRIGPFNGWL